MKYYKFIKAAFFKIINDYNEIIFLTQHKTYFLLLFFNCAKYEKMFSNAYHDQLIFKRSIKK